MTLSTDDFTIELVAEHFDYDPTSADNAASYSRAYSLSNHTSSAHGIRVSRGTDLVASVIVLAGGGASAIHDHSAILRRDALLLAVGPYVVRLAVPSLDLVWS